MWDENLARRTCHNAEAGHHGGNSMGVKCTVSQRDMRLKDVGGRKEMAVTSPNILLVVWVYFHCASRRCQASAALRLKGKVRCNLCYVVLTVIAKYLQLFHVDRELCSKPVYPERSYRPRRFER